MKGKTGFFKTLRGGLFFKYFLSYFLVFSVPLLLTLFVYSSSARIISAQSSGQATSLLEQTRTIIDARMYEMKSIKLALQSSETLLEFQDTWARDDGRDEIFQAYKASASLPVYSLVNTAVENVSVFFPSSDGEECFVISSKNAMRYSREMGSVWLGAEEASYEELYAFLTGESFYDEFTFFGQSDSGLVPLAQGDGALSEPSVFFLSSLNDNGRGSAPVVLIRISDSFFEEMLSGVTIDGAGASFIVNGSGSFISYYGGKGTGSLDDATLARLLETSAGQEADHFLFEGYQVNRVRSNFTDWTYYSVIPQQAIYQELNHVHTVIALAAAIIILLGLLLCYLLTKKNSKPLKLIIRSLTTVYDHGRFDPEDDFQFIENAVSALVASNLAYHEKEKDIGSKTDGEVLWRLFLGEGIDTAAFQRDLENSSIRLAGTQFVTGYLHVHGLDNSKQSAFFTKSSLWALLSQLFPEEGKSVHPLVIDKSNLVFLAVFGQEEAASQFCGELSLRLEGLGKQIEKDTGWHLDFFLSEAMRLAENVQVGYQQCKDLALRVVKDSGKFVYTTQDLPAFQQIYRYTMDQELRLAQLLQYGTQEELQAFLDELFEQNLRKLQLSDGMQKSFFTAVQNSALRSLSRFQLEKGAIHHETLNSPQELRAYLSQLQEATQRSLGIQAQQAQEEKKQAVLAFIKEHYGEADLMIYPLCEELGCSESSLNRFIHEQLGLSFSDLLEKTRMEAACALLQRGGLTVKAIAEQTGYASDASFRRAFKRVMGVSPSDYLRAHRAEGSSQENP